MPCVALDFTLPITHLPWHDFRNMENVRRPSWGDPSDAVESAPRRASLNTRRPEKAEGRRKARQSTPALLPPEPRSRPRCSTPAADSFSETLKFTVASDTVDSFVVHGRGARTDVIETYTYRMGEGCAHVQYVVAYRTKGCMPRPLTWFRLYVRARRHAREMRDMFMERTRRRSSVCAAGQGY